MLDIVTPPLNDEDAAADIETYERLKDIVLYPFHIEYLAFKGVLIQLFFATRDFLLLPIFLIKPSKDPLKTQYNSVVALGLIITCAIMHIFSITIEDAVEIISQQKIYKIWAIYTIVIIMVRYTPKMHNMGYQAIRGALRLKKSLVGPLITKIVADSFEYFLLTLQAGTLIAGSGGKNNLFLSAVLHIEFIVFKKFIPKASDGNPLVFEATNRILMGIAVLNHWQFAKYNECYVLIFCEYFFAMIRFYFVAFSDEASKYQRKMEKCVLQAESELNGIYLGPLSTSFYVYSPHESIALILTTFTRVGSIKFRLTSVLILIGMVVVSTFVPNYIFKTDGVTKADVADDPEEDAAEKPAKSKSPKKAAKIAKEPKEPVKVEKKAEEPVKEEKKDETEGKIQDDDE